MSDDPRGGAGRDAHISELGSRQDGSGAHARGDTRSDTYQAETSSREAMQQELMDLGRWLTEHPKARDKNLKPVRGSVILQPGIYYNSGTGMVERIYTPQHIALGSRWFRVSKDPAAPTNDVRRRVLEGK